MFILEQPCKTFMNTLNIGKTRLNVFFLTSRSVIIYSSMYHPKYVSRRIEKRGRSEEKTVSLTYLQKLYYEHQMLNQVINPRVIHNDRYIYDNDELETQVESMLKYL